MGFVDSLLTSYKYDTNFNSEQTAMLASQDAGLSGVSMTDISGMMGKISPIMTIFGAVNSAIGSFYAAESQKYQLQSQASSFRFQQEIAGINARAAEVTAQQIQYAGERQIGQYTMRAGQARGATRAAMAARGGVIGTGSNQEIIASQDLIKEIDVLTINANTVRQAEAARMQKVNYGSQATMLGVSAANADLSAQTISPFSSMMSSLLTSATGAAGSFYRDNELKRLLARGGA